MAASQATQRPTLLAGAIPLAGMTLLILFGIAYVVAPALYGSVLRMWMLSPFPHPFIDWEFLPSAARCWAQGIDVYVDNTCYAPVAHGRFSYSPLWLRFDFLPDSPQSVMVAGVALAALFYGSIGLLPVPRRRLDWFAFALVAFSSLTVFGVERGNADLIVFVATVIGVRLWLGGPASRTIGYGVFLLAGLLKFYPFALMVLALYERPGRFTQITILSIGLAAAVLLPFWDELQRALAAVPSGSPFTDLFGARNLSLGLPAFLIHFKTSVWKIDVLPRIVTPAAVILSAAGVIWLTFGTRRLRGAMAVLPRLTLGFLVAGAALICGCFFAGQSVGYRGIFLLLTLPGLFALRRNAGGLVAWVLRCTIWSIVFVMWVLTLEAVSRHLHLTPQADMDSGVGFGLAHWVCHEFAWWMIVTTLLSALLSFAITSPSGLLVRTKAARMWRRPRASSHAEPAERGVGA